MRFLFGALSVIAFVGVISSATAQRDRDRDRDLPPIPGPPPIERLRPPPLPRDLPDPPAAVERHCKRVCAPKDPEDCRRRGLRDTCNGEECHEDCTRHCRSVCVPRDPEDCRRRGLRPDCNGVACRDLCD